ncbi:hypothetical protein [Stratiformator vulcanicus]|uniref:hypothetical protein n=1 Tax=Stratiformator vulcanicus TaxID=2527980 RepID=UPI0011AACEFD|nr:hypothetical protein [Stratiformator vulcanicus]
MTGYFGYRHHKPTVAPCYYGFDAGYIATARPVRPSVTIVQNAPSLGAWGLAPAAPAAPVAATPEYVGTWTAQPSEGVIVTLSLEANGNFVWQVKNNGQQTQFGGTYQLDGDQLSLVNADAGNLTGTITWQNGGFGFLRDNAPEGDAGLNFAG